jgi:hypothetical protein
MSAAKATWKNGQVVFDGPVNWRDGSRLVVRQETPDEIEFMREDEQADDPGSVQRWIDELRAIPALSMTPAQEADWLAWRQKVREFNIEAVRRQMEEGVR